MNTDIYIIIILNPIICNANLEKFKQIKHKNANKIMNTLIYLYEILIILCNHREIKLT